MKEYKLYCVEICRLEMICDGELCFKITIDLFLRNFSIKNRLDKDICQGT